MKTGNLYRTIVRHYFFPSKEVLKAAFSFEDDSEQFYLKHESEIGSLGSEVIFALLEQDHLAEIGFIYKVLLNDGKIGWIICSNEQFEEMVNL